jgi:hypothetical protein
MLDRTRERFALKRWHEVSDQLRPAHQAETTEEVERLRQTEREISAATGWNSSTMVIGRLLERLRGGFDDE